MQKEAEEEDDSEEDEEDEDDEDDEDDDEAEKRNRRSSLAMPRNCDHWWVHKMAMMCSSSVPSPLEPHESSLSRGLCSKKQTSWRSCANI